MTYDEALVATNGNEQAALFLVAYVRYCHLLDDIIDQDKELTDERLVKESLDFIGHFGCNPWVMGNFSRLFPLVVSGFNAWLDANKMEKSDVEQVRLSSDTVKGIYHEMVYVVAYICGGHEHMRTVSKQREYDYDQKKKGGV